MVFYPHFSVLQNAIHDTLLCSCFADFFMNIFNTREEYGFLLNPPVEGIVNSIEQKTRVFCQTDVQEFHLWI
jgi:hypothetical protein